jgi:peptide/nickel transport system substrate-binding protein
MALSIDRAKRLRIRRRLRRRQKQVESATQAAEVQFETNLIGRFDRLVRVKRFVFSWILLLVLVSFCTVLQTLAQSKYYQTLSPVPGGTYNEGMVGTYSNANPLYAAGAVDSAVSHLIFAGLMKYDDHAKLVGDLASSYSVDETGRHYTVHLRPGLTWQDGQPLTAKDVVFTYHTIQNPDANSPLRASWQGITVAAKDKLTVTFDLPSTLSSFVYSLTGGIIPEHLLAKVPPAQLRSNAFNTLHPVGAGPFAWQALQTGHSTDPAQATTFIALQPFEQYAGGAPKLNGFVVRAYASEDQLIDAYKKREINAMSGLNEVPASLKGHSDLVVHSFPSSAAFMTFFKTTAAPLNDTQVRQALVSGANVPAIIASLGYTTTPVREPLLIDQLGYDPKYRQAAYDPTAAEAKLEAAGWVRGADGLRHKDGQTLTFRLYAQDIAESRLVTKQLVADWRKIGVDAVPVLQNQSDFETTLEFHTYDALLYGISIGEDPDVFAYWDSSQADIRATNRFNFSEYDSTEADTSLEAGRTRLDPQLRVIKYRPFLEAWQADAPALGLYQPRYLYLTRGPVYGLHDHVLNIATDRFDSVQNWMIRTAKVTNQ